MGRGKVRPKLVSCHYLRSTASARIHSTAVQRRRVIVSLTQPRMMHARESASCAALAPSGRKCLSRAGARHGTARMLSLTATENDVELRNPSGAHGAAQWVCAWEEWKSKRWIRGECNRLKSRDACAGNSGFLGKSESASLPAAPSSSERAPAPHDY